MFWSSKENNGKDKDNDDDKRRAAAAQTVKIEAQKKTAKKKKEPDENPSTPSASEADFEKSKRRNSLTDSPLTELSPSSNGDSADDIGSEGSKHEEMVSTNSSTSLSGVYSVNSPHKDRHTCDFPEGNFVLNETETIDAMELEYVHEILVETNKLIKQLKYNKWTDALCRTIILGDFIGFNRRFKLVMQCLKKRKPQQYGAISSQQLAAFVAQSIVERFHNSAEETTILMILLANHDQAFSCAQHGHGHCRIAHMLLKLLDKAELTRLLEAKAIRTGKTALHLAVATGNPCQLGVLLGLADLNPNTIDKSGRAPIHYAVERNSLQMVKMLMWYGADISMVQSENSKFSSLYISQCVDPNATVNHWLQERLKAVSRKTMALARELCAKHYHVQKELSGTHFIRLDGNSSLQRECQLNLHSAPNLFHVAKPHAHNQHSQPKSRAILFMIPIVFRASDEYSAASDPKIVRVFFPRDVIVSGQPILDSLTDGEHQATKLPPVVLNRYHNEAFYAFELQDSLNVGLYRLSCRLGSPALNKQQRDGIIVAVQAFLCNSLTEKGGKSKTD